MPRARATAPSSRISIASTTTPLTSPVVIRGYPLMMTVLYRWSIASSFVRASSGWEATLAQNSCPGPYASAERCAIVQFTVDDQNRRVEVLHKLVRRPATVHRRIAPRRSLKLPLRKPKLFGGAVHAFEVVNTIVRNQHFETEPRIVVVSEDPVDHVTTVTRPGRADAVTIEERIMTQHIGDAVHDVDVSLAAPIAANLIHKLLSVSGRAARVRRKHDVARVRKHFRVPAITPAIVPRALRTAMDQNQKRIFLVCVEVVRLHDIAVNLVAHRSRPLHIFRWFQIRGAHELCVN